MRIHEFQVDTDLASVYITKGISIETKMILPFRFCFFGFLLFFRNEG